MSPAPPSWPRQSCQKAWLSHSRCAAPFSARPMGGAIPISSTALISGSAGPDLASSRNTIRLALCHPARALTSIHPGTSSSTCRRPYRDLGQPKQNSCIPVRATDSPADKRGFTLLVPRDDRWLILITLIYPEDPSLLRKSSEILAGGTDSLI